MAHTITNDPTPDDGEFVLWVPERQELVAADSLHDIVAFVVSPHDPGSYLGLDDPDLEAATRQDHLLGVLARATIMLYPAGVDDLLASGLDEDHIDHYMRRMNTLDDLGGDTSDLEDPSAFAEDHPFEWRADFPMVLVANDYEPHEPRELPTGNVVLLEWTDERTFLDSLLRLNAALEEAGKLPELEFFERG